MTYKEFVLTLANAYYLHAAPYWTVAFICYVIATDELHDSSSETYIRQKFKALDKNKREPQSYVNFSNDLKIAIDDWLKTSGCGHKSMGSFALSHYLDTMEKDRNILRAMWLEKYAESL